MLRLIHRRIRGRDRQFPHALDIRERPDEAGAHTHRYLHLVLPVLESKLLDGGANALGDHVSGTVDLELAR